jgi:hypothetical protein
LPEDCLYKEVMMNKKILLAIALVFVFALVAFSFEQFKRVFLQDATKFRLLIFH